MKLKDQVLIKKASGQIVPFSPEHLKRSLHKAGASAEEVERIVKEVTTRLYEGISTKKIYSLAFNSLRKASGYKAARYHLKRGIMELGPSGFPFEKFIAEVLKREGFHTHAGVISQGKCISHEVDVIAEKGDEFIMIECKYHNRPGLFSDVKVPLYVNSRFEDLKSAWMKIPGKENRDFRGWVVTNTRFSIDAIKYGACAGLKLLGWDYPVNEGLKDQIDRLGLYPVTCLTTLTKTEKQQLLEMNVVLCTELLDNDQFLHKIGIRESKIDAVKSEVSKLCDMNNKRY